LKNKILHSPWKFKNKSKYFEYDLSQRLVGNKYKTEKINSNISNMDSLNGFVGKTNTHEKAN
jgi:hypothetical protein